MDFSAAWVVLIGAHAGKPSHAGVRSHAFTMRATVGVVSRSSSMVGGGVLAPASIDGAQCRPAGCVASHPGHRCTSRSPKGSRSRTSVRWFRRDGGGSAGAGGPRGGWLWFFGKIRRSAGRDRAPQTQRRCGMVDGRRCGWWWLTAGRTPGPVGLSRRRSSSYNDGRSKIAKEPSASLQALLRDLPPFWWVQGGYRFPDRETIPSPGCKKYFILLVFYGGR
jgi:hypothetical protein